MKEMYFSKKKCDSKLWMDSLSFGSWTRLSYSLIKWNMWLLKKNNLYHHLCPLTGWTNWSMNNVHIGNLNWRHFYPVIISTYILYPLNYAFYLSLIYKKINPLVRKKIKAYFCVYKIDKHSQLNHLIRQR